MVVISPEIVELVKKIGGNTNVRYFVFSYEADLNEGRDFRKRGMVLVHALRDHRAFAEQWAYENFGNRIGFCMGVYNSSCITELWRFDSGFQINLQHYPILAKLEDLSVQERIFT